MFISKVRTVVIGLLLAAHCHAQSASPASGAAVTALPDRVRLSEILIETPQPYDSSPADTWDPKMWIAIGAAFGTLVTALTNLVRWWRERSFTHTIHEQSQQIVGLFQLLETLPAEMVQPILSQRGTLMAAIVVGPFLNRTFPDHVFGHTCPITRRA